MDLIDIYRPFYQKDADTHLFVISWATPVAHGDSQPRGQIGAVATGLHQSHSNGGSELRLQPTPQLMAMLDP